MKLVALAALVTMLCMAGIAAADTVTVSGDLDQAFSWAGLVAPLPSFTSWLAQGANTASGTTSATTNVAWHVDVSATNNPMASGTLLLHNNLKIASSDSAPTLTATDIGVAAPTTLSFPFPGTITGASGPKTFDLSQLVDMRDAPVGATNPYTTTLTITGAAL